MKDLSIAMVSLGIIGILINLPDWKKYFQRSLAEVVMHQSYLNTLDKEELIGIQKSTLKAFFENEKIDRRGSLLEYCQVKLQKYIGEPYRENVRRHIKLDKADGDGYLHEKSLTYYECRKAKSHIQHMIPWSNKLSEMNEEVNSIGLYIKCPIGLRKTCPVKPSCKFEKENCGKWNLYEQWETEKIQKAIMQDPKEPGDKSIELVCDLKFYKAIDKLSVKIETDAMLSQESFFVWRMAVPSMGCYLAVSYPIEFRLLHSLFGADDSELEIVNEDGFFAASCKSWLLPKSGLAFQLIPKK